MLGDAFRRSFGAPGVADWRELRLDTNGDAGGESDQRQGREGVVGSGGAKEMMERQLVTGRRRGGS